MKKIFSFLLAGLWLMAPAVLIAESKQFRLMLELNVAMPPADQKAAQARAVKTYQKRLANLGIRNCEVKAEADRLVRVRIFEVPPEQMQRVKETIITSAKLEFRLVHPESVDLIKQEIIPPNYEQLTEKGTRQGKPYENTFLVGKKTVGGLNASHIKDARADTDPISGNPQIALEFTTEGQALFAKVTEENVDRQLAIVLNGKLCSAPLIREPITAGRAVISGSFTRQEVEDLARVLSTPLDVPVRIIDESNLNAAEEKAITRRKNIKLALFAMGGLLVFVGLAVAAFVIIQWLVRRANREAAPPKIN